MGEAIIEHSVGYQRTVHFDPVMSTAQRGVDRIRQAFLDVCTTSDQGTQVNALFARVMTEAGDINFKQELDVFLSGYIKQADLTSYFQMLGVIDRLVYMRKCFGLQA